MESPRVPRTARTTTTCTVPGLLVGLTKLCKLTKVCAAPALDDETTKSAFLNCGGYDQRLILTRLFETIASLKSAYIKLQRAHFPYDPAKIAFADEIVTSELDSAAALQCLCGTSSGVGALVNERWAVVQVLEAEMRKKDSGIVLLKRELDGLQRENSRLNRQIKIKNSSFQRDKAFVAPQELTTTPGELLERFKLASSSVQDFAGLIMSMLVSSDRSVSVRNADAAEAAEQSWKRYALEAYLWRTMLSVSTGTEEEGEFDVNVAARFDGILRFCDPLDALMQYPSSSFSRFCRRTYLAAVPSETEAAMFRNVEQRAFVSRGGHPRTWFYRAFATTARSTWALRVAMARGFGSRRSVRMFYARRGSKYKEEFMEPAFGTGEDHGVEKLSVAFTVTPGVKIGDAVVPCRVFLSHSGDAINIR